MTTKAPRFRTGFRENPSKTLLHHSNKKPDKMCAFDPDAQQKIAWTKGLSRRP
jgi:hypothetical protein